jgi:hypothetical protein
MLSRITTTLTMQDKKLRPAPPVFQQIKFIVLSSCASFFHTNPSILSRRLTLCDSVGFNVLLIFIPLSVSIVPLYSIPAVLTILSGHSTLLT